MAKQKSFTNEFEAEAVRLAQTSGRTQREIAHDLSVGLTTLVRWIGHSGDQAMDAPTGSAAREDMAAELKRLRRENEILKRAATFFSQGGKSMKFRFIDQANE